MKKLTNERIAELEALAPPDDTLDFSDLPELTDELWANAEWIDNKKKKKISIYLDQDLLHWLKANSSKYQTFINSILRTYMEAKKRETGG